MIKIGNEMRGREWMNVFIGHSELVEKNSRYCVFFFSIWFMHVQFQKNIFIYVSSIKNREKFVNQKSPQKNDASSWRE